MSLRRQHPWMRANISASLLFWAGMLVLPAYFFQSHLGVRLGQVIFFGMLATVAGKRLFWLYFGAIIATITVFHLLVPSGIVLFDVADFPITLGALRTGFYKALTIVGMVFISLVSVRADLRLPGRAGSLAGKVFWSFEQIMERRHELEPRRPVVSGDRLLLSLYDQISRIDESHARTGERKDTASVSTTAGRGVVAFVVGLQWVLLFVSV